MIRTQNRGNIINIFFTVTALIISFVLFSATDYYTAAENGNNSGTNAVAFAAEISLTDAMAPADEMAGEKLNHVSSNTSVSASEEPLEPPTLPASMFDPPPAVKCAYLTFDDGPSENTPRILDILDEYGVKATFFVCGKNKNYYKDIVDRGHTIALHANNHDYKVCYASEEAYFNDLMTLRDSIEEMTGIKPRLLRFPGGSSNTVSSRYSNGLMKRLVVEVQNRGFIYHDWNVDSKDAVQANISAQSIINNIYTGMQKKDIIDVLMHDSGTSKNTTVEALPKIISMLLESGYTILPITERTEPIQHNLEWVK